MYTLPWSFHELPSYSRVSSVTSNHKVSIDFKFLIITTMAAKEKKQSGTFINRHLLSEHSVNVPATEMYRQDIMF